jgi:hypothetical protein
MLRNVENQKWSFHGRRLFRLPTLQLMLSTVRLPQLVSLEPVQLRTSRKREAAQRNWPLFPRGWSYN